MEFSLNNFVRNLKSLTCRKECYDLIKTHIGEGVHRKCLERRKKGKESVNDLFALLHTKWPNQISSLLVGPVGGG